MKGLSLEIRVGLLVLAALGLLVSFVFTLGGFDFSAKYTVYVDFDNPGSIKPGAPVQIGSLKVGSVDAIEYRGGALDPRTGTRALIRVKLAIDQSVRDTVHEDALFYVTSQSLLGESLIAIDPGSYERPVLAEDAVVVGVDPPRLDLAMALAYELLDNMVGLFRNHRGQLKEMLENLGGILRSVNQLLTEHRPQLARIIQNVEEATGEASALMNTARETIDGAEVQRTLANIDRTMQAVARDIAPIMIAVRETTTKANGVLDVIGPDQQLQLQNTIADISQLTRTAQGTLGDAQAIVSHVRSGEGTVGALMMDEELYDDIQEMLRDLKHNPWKLFWRE
ncbi:MAG: MlaD family protein [Myxococcota bacterium]